MTATAAVFDIPDLSATTRAVAREARTGLLQTPKTLSPWLFYDESGSALFEEITRLPEYYPTRTERKLLEDHSAEILREFGFSSVPAPHALPLRAPLAIAELGAGTAAKTGVLLRALAHLQPKVVYQPIDVSVSALDQARLLETTIPGVRVQPCVANYVVDDYILRRTASARMLALYIGSSIGNFFPQEAQAVLTKLRTRLRSGDGLLLGADLPPGRHKSVEQLCAAYDDARGVTAAFNRNVLVRLNRELGANFQPDRFEHVALWNGAESRVEMHLRSASAQTVIFPANSCGPGFDVRLQPGETIHTENSYKFTERKIRQMLTSAGFTLERTFQDENRLFALHLAKVQ